MMSLGSVLVLGFLIGLKHATEADHLAAVATLVTRRTSMARAIYQGAAWGLGHTLTLMLFGGVVLAMGQVVPERLAQWLEMAVGVMLILLGLDVLRRLRKDRLHFHVHRHQGGVEHFHLHSHGHDADAGNPLQPATAAGWGQAAAARTTFRPAHNETMHEHAHTLPVRALAVGMVHGMAGSAALILLTLQTTGSWKLGLIYIAVFGIGSICGMALLSAAIAVPLRMSAGRLGPLHRQVMATVGLATCFFGAYRIAAVGGLFGA